MVTFRYDPLARKGVFLVGHGYDPLASEGVFLVGPAARNERGRRTGKEGRGEVGETSLNRINEVYSAVKKLNLG